MTKYKVDIEEDNVIPSIKFFQDDIDRKTKTSYLSHCIIALSKPTFLKNFSKTLIIIGCLSISSVLVFKGVTLGYQEYKINQVENRAIVEKSFKQLQNEIKYMVESDTLDSSLKGIENYYKDTINTALYIQYKYNKKVNMDYKAKDLLAEFNFMQMKLATLKSRVLETVENPDSISTIYKYDLNSINSTYRILLNSRIQNYQVEDINTSFFYELNNKINLFRMENSSIDISIETVNSQGK